MQSGLDGYKLALANALYRNYHQSLYKEDERHKSHFIQFMLTQEVMDILKALSDSGHRVISDEEYYSLQNRKHCYGAAEATP